MQAYFHRPMSPLILVLLILGGLLLVQAAVWIPLILIFKKRSAEFMAAFHRQLESSGEKLLRGPEKGIYRGATQGFGAVRGNGVIMLTDRRLVFRKMTGGVVEIPVKKITGSHEAKVFMRSVVGGQTHFVVDTSDKAEIGFFVADNAAWAQALKRASTS